jgi:hypothetical protein
VVAIGQGITTTNTDAVLIGRSAGASGGTGTNSVAVGAFATAKGNGIAIGWSSHATQTTNIAIGYGANVAGTDSVGIGNTITAGGAANVTIGNSATGTGANCVRIGNSVATGTNTGVVAIGVNSSGLNNSVGIGYLCYATGIESTVIGYNAGTNQTLSTVIGAGANNTKIRTFVKGVYGYPRHYGAESRRIDTNTSTSDATNPSRHNEDTAWIGSTPDATPKILTLFDVAGERLTLQDNEALHFDIMITAKQNTSTNTLVRRIAGGAVRGSGVGTTAIVGQTTLYTHGTALTTTVSADTTNGAVAIEVTGNVNTWQWTALVNYQRTKTA